MDDRIISFEPNVQRQLISFIRTWFASEDALLRSIRESISEHGLPEIQIRPEEGQILMFLAELIQAQHVVEIGTLAGYSSLWIARGLPSNGRMITLEALPAHARLARSNFERSEISHQIELVEGDALKILPTLNQQGPFDMVFIDADKQDYPHYLEWALANVRPGGLITAHNAFRGGALLNDEPESVGIRRYLETTAKHPKLRSSTIIPVGDGIALAIVK